MKDQVVDEAKISANDSDGTITVAAKAVKSSFSIDNILNEKQVQENEYKKETDQHENIDVGNEDSDKKQVDDVFKAIKTSSLEGDININLKSMIALSALASTSPPTSSSSSTTSSSSSNLNNSRTSCCSTFGLYQTPWYLTQQKLNPYLYQTLSTTQQSQQIATNPAQATSFQLFTRNGSNDSIAAYNRLNCDTLNHHQAIFKQQTTQYHENSGGVSLHHQHHPHHHHPYLTGSSIFTRPKKKRSRAAFSHAQVLELEKRFNFQRYLSGPERADLASSLKVKYKNFDKF